MYHNHQKLTLLNDMFNGGTHCTSLPLS